MPTILQTQFLPETDHEVLRRFSVVGPLAVRAILDDLVRERALITLYSPRDHEEFVVSQILGWNDAGIRFDFTTDAGRRQAILGAGSIVVVAFLDRIKIQFDRGPAACQRRRRAVVAGLRAAAAGPPDPAPRRLPRAPAVGACCRMRDPRDRRGRARVPRARHQRGRRRADGAARARCARARRTVAALPAEIPGYPPIPCDLEVRFVSEGLRGDAAASRIGCEFHRPLPQTQRAVQMYVMDVERGKTPPPGHRPDAHA